MDSSAVNTNVTVDDFDSVLSYPDQAAWTTPDPSSADYHPGSSQWLLGTYHKTDTVNASVSFNFTGPSLYIYGFSGPDYGSYEVQLDSNSTTSSAYSATNGSTPHLLFGANNLTYGSHEVTLRNLGAKDNDKGGNALLFDFLQFGVQLAPAGATVSNTTLQENDSSLTYTGTWGNNTSGNFSGEGSAYTNGDQASVSFKFNASAIYIFGDKKNDHGLYSVSLDNTSSSQPFNGVSGSQVYNGVSGCGGAFGMTCEQQQPCLKFLASNLGEGEHEVKIVNMPGVNQSFFDLDSVVLTVPSTYAPRTLDNSTSASSSNSSSSSTTPGSSSGSGSSNSAIASKMGDGNSFILNIMMLLGFLWVFRVLRR